MKPVLAGLAVAVLAHGAFAVSAPVREGPAVQSQGGFGLVPSTTDFLHLRNGLKTRLRTKGASAPLPSRWDSREAGWVSPVKDQGLYGTCWAHSTMACLETADLKASNGAVTNDFSENHMARHDVGFAVDFGGGGNNQIATALLSGWRDPLFEGDDPYPDPESDVSRAPCRHVQDVVWLPERDCPTFRRIPEEYAVDPVTDNREVDEAYKRAVMEYGAVAIGYHHCAGNYDPDNGAYYLSRTNYVASPADGGHAVTLVGWDDDYPAENFLEGRRPPGDGAFLCKNSWGGDGTLWISYYDELVFDQIGAAYPRPEAPDNFARVYQYDPCGQVVSWNCYDDEEEELLGGKENWCANVFTAVSTGAVAVVGFYAMENGSTYTIRIVRGCTDGPSAGSVVVEQSGVATNAGFVTVRLSEAVPLTAVGEKFAVVMHLECPTYAYPMAVETSSAGYSYCVAHAGESFMSKDGTVWRDFQEYDEYGNFCIKAYTEYAPGDVRRYEPTTLYVDGQGDPAAQDGTEEHPFVEIQFALNVAIPGDEVLVAPGVYRGVLNETDDVTVISTDGAGTTIIDGRGEVRCLDDWGSATLVGFTLVNGRSEDGSGGGGACYGSLVNCVISNCRADIGGGAANGDLYNCLVVSNTASSNGGGVCDVFAYNCTIADNVAGECGGGICMFEYYGGCGEAVNCITAFNTSLLGREFGDDIYDETGYVIKCFSGGDPSFADRQRGDYRLSGGSPCIDAGYADCCLEDFGDLDGAARIVGASVDLGCYEYAQAVLFGELERHVSAAGQTVVVSVYADGGWTLSSDVDWLTTETIEGFGRADVRVGVGANDTGAARSGTLTLSGEGCDCSPTLRFSQIAGMPRGGRRYGLFVGVNQYDKSFVPKSRWLGGCVTDATNMLERCVGGRLWHAENVTLLKDSGATKGDIRAWFDEAAAKAVAGDTVLYYQSSHGGNEIYDQKSAYLCAYDARYYDSELSEDLARFVPGVRVVVIADACHSGGLFKSAPATSVSFGWDFGARVMSMLSSASDGRRKKSLGSSGGSAEVAFITAADYDQYSWENGVIGSDFTLAMTYGWSTGEADLDGDGMINFRELYDFAAPIATGVPEYVDERTEAQCLNEPMLLGLMAEVLDPKWPDPGVEPDDSPTVVASKVAAALEGRGYTGAVTTAVTTVAQYDELARWTEETGVTPAQQSAAEAPLVSAALSSEGLVDFTAKDVLIVGFAPSGADWLCRLRVKGYDFKRVNPALLSAAIGVVGSATADGEFSSDGLETAVSPDEDSVVVLATPPPAAMNFFFRGFVR